MSAGAKLAGRMFSALAPPEDLTPSQWAELHRRLSPEASSKAGGLFSFEDFPWQREPIDMIDSPDHGRMVFMWASQVTGKTETINNLIGSQIDLAPAPMLILQPTVDLGQTWSKDRFDTMRRDTPRIRNRVRGAKSRDAGNTILHKQFPGGRLTIVGANAPRQLAMRPIKLVFADEVDGYPASAGKEGDPIKLAEKRTESFPDAFIVLTSTPTIKGLSRVEREFLDSDQRRWHCPCPKCSQFQVLEWSQIHWDNDDPTTARLICQHCEAELTDADRQTMIRAGEWRADKPGAAVLGYHLNGINALIPPKRPWKTRLEQMVFDHLEAQRNEEERKTWINTFLADTYEPPADKQDPNELLKRREAYPAQVPAGGLLLFKTVDVQKDRLEVYTEAAGEDDETWAIDYRVIAGDPTKPAVWDQLTEDEATIYTHENGHQMQALYTGIDEGYKRDDVRKWVKRKRRQRLALKGDAKAGALLFRVQKKAVQGLRPYHIGTDTAKDQLFSELEIDEHGPGYQHFPLDDEKFGPDYFDQLTAEQCVTEYDKRGFPKRVWKLPKGRRNEALDLKVYAKGLRKIYLYHRRPNLKALAEQLAEPANPDADQDTPTARDYYLTKQEKTKAPTARAQQKAKRAARPRKSGFANRWKK